MKELIKDIKKKSPILKFVTSYIFNKYTITLVAFFAWMIFFDNTSFLVVNELNGDITKYEHQLAYYKAEYEKNDAFYKKLMNNKDEKEKYARENYFMKKPNEEIFILVADSTKIDKK
ncbi:septum formation initiator family protein [Soonwooa sp.]|uniref:FtsB family cell division protein n=1 Tax=Soonwooa sp. TaxID=1938592 RepID=UPI002609FE71|nr:septum formation initiator family protein [Soonwooa sp.]